MKDLAFFATVPKGLETVSAGELESLGGRDVKVTVAGVAFRGDLRTAYKACLWSRTANRILLTLAKFDVLSVQDLYDGVRAIDWFEHMAAQSSFWVSFTGQNRQINNTLFGAQKVKDAVADQMRERFHIRPNVTKHKPDLHLHVHLKKNQAEVSLDLSGDSLHKRGFRDVSVAAPIKENLAAAMLLLCDWPELAKNHATLLDPMCGSGTLLLEGAMIAADWAPGLQHDYFGFLGWKQHQVSLWASLLAEAQVRRVEGTQALPRIVGYDRDRRAVASALKQIENAGLSGKIHIEKRDFRDIESIAHCKPGLLIANPPYGERLADKSQVADLYSDLGTWLKQQCLGWQAALIIHDEELGFRLGLRSKKPLTLYNGALECRFLRMAVVPEAFFTPKPRTPEEHLEQLQQRGHNEAVMFANRLEKNFKKLDKWARRQAIFAYRVYDADIPEYALAVDIYKGDAICVNVQEYQPPATVDPDKAQQRLAAALAEIPRVLGVEPENIYLKVRRKQKDKQQYEKAGDSQLCHVISEGACRFWVNFSDYLDTGLFLDHRPLRSMIHRLADGKRFLNLFAYTATATVHAAVGGAVSSVTVDKSKTYLDWAQRNFVLNGLGDQHQLVREDCMQWLSKQVSASRPPQFELIFVDPPTFSNSKDCDQVFDIQKAHVLLLKQASALLTPDGTLFFSTNFKRFKLDQPSLAGLHIEDITALTVDEDFSRNRKIHYCWRITRCKTA